MKLKDITEVKIPTTPNVKKFGQDFIILPKTYT